MGQDAGEIVGPAPKYSPPQSVQFEAIIEKVRDDLWRTGDWLSGPQALISPRGLLAGLDRESKARCPFGLISSSPLPSKDSCILNPMREFRKCSKFQLQGSGRESAECPSGRTDMTEAQPVPSLFDQIGLLEADCRRCEGPEAVRCDPVGGNRVQCRPVWVETRKRIS